MTLPETPDYDHQFSAALGGGDLPAGLTARDPAEVERRFAVYRNNVTVSLTAALATRFPVIQRLVGEDFFSAMARLYAQQDRPKSPVLAEWGAGFAPFLEGFAPLAAYPYLGDVARIEYARGQAFHAADAQPVSPAALAAADPGRVRLGLHPSARVLVLGYPAVSIWRRNQPGGQDLPVGTGPETALIFRDAGFQVPVWALGRGDAALMAALLAGEKLATAAASAEEVQGGYQPQDLLVALMRAGVITDARSD